MTGTTAGILSATPNSALASDAEIIGHKLWGSGSNKVIFLHDWSVSTDGDYTALLPFLNDKELKVAFADVRGYGMSKAMTGSYTLEEISNDIAALADILGWSKFSILGHSMTGMAVQKIAVDMPKRLNKVVATVPIPASGFPLDEKTFAFLNQCQPMMKLSNKVCMP